MSYSVTESFEEVGGRFVSPVSDIRKKLGRIRVFVFDWDGVFNRGIKGHSIAGTYSEADSMGTNLLRFSSWMDQDRLPVMAILTGQGDLTAIDFALREHFNYIYLNSIHKDKAFSHLLEILGIDPEEAAFCFDDVLDLPIAQRCGLRFMVRRMASPLFREYVTQRNLCDYLTGQQGDNHAVREIVELILGLRGDLDLVIQERIKFTGPYQRYLVQRSLQKTEAFILKDNRIVKYKLPQS
ncbi:MAG: phosphatase [Nitrospiraceae bacterium]|nr:phosphatase [Nitrospiraceae bacterium]